MHTTKILPYEPDEYEPAEEVAVFYDGPEWM